MITICLYHKRQNRISSKYNWHIEMLLIILIKIMMIEYECCVDEIAIIEMNNKSNNYYTIVIISNDYKNRNIRRITLVVTMAVMFIKLNNNLNNN